MTHMYVYSLLGPLLQSKHKVNASGVCVLSGVWHFVTPWTVAPCQGSSIHGISQARILEWAAISFCRRSSQPRDDPCLLYWQVDSLPLVSLGWFSSQESACQCRRQEFNPWVGKIPWRRKWQPNPVFLPGNFIDRGTWQATVHGVAQQLDTTEWLNHHYHQTWSKEGTGPILCFFFFKTSVTIYLLFLFIFILFWAMLFGMWDLSSSTRNWTHTPCIGSMES